MFLVWWWCLVLYVSNVTSPSLAYLQEQIVSEKELVCKYASNIQCHLNGFIYYSILPPVSYLLPYLPLHAEIKLQNHFHLALRTSFYNQINSPSNIAIKTYVRIQPIQPTWYNQEHTTYPSKLNKTTFNSTSTSTTHHNQIKMAPCPTCGEGGYHGTCASCGAGGGFGNHWVGGRRIYERSEPVRVMKRMEFFSLWNHWSECIERCLAGHLSPFPLSINIHGCSFCQGGYATLWSIMNLYTEYIHWT